MCQELHELATLSTLPATTIVLHPQFKTPNVDSVNPGDPGDKYKMGTGGAEEHQGVEYASFTSQDDFEGNVKKTLGKHSTSAMSMRSMDGADPDDGFDALEDDGQPCPNSLLLLLSPALQSGLTSPQIVFAIIKGIVGPAILYIPHGFLEGGYGNSSSVTHALCRALDKSQFDNFLRDPLLRVVWFCSAYLRVLWQHKCRCLLSNTVTTGNCCHTLIHVYRCCG